MSDQRVRSAVFVAVLVCWLVGGGVLAANAATPAPGAASGPVAETTSPQFAVQADGEAENDTDNITRRHRDPREYDEPGDLSALEDRLLTRMIEDLEEGALSLDDGEYDRAMRSVDESYLDDLERYEAVVDETEGENYEELFALAGENQRRLVDDVERYNATRAEYERARAAGDDERARDLARDLEAIAASVDETSRELRENYDEIESSTDADLDESDDAIEAVVEEIRTEQASIRETEFVATELVVDAERSRISFSEPLIATGRLRTADGRPVGEESIRLEVGNGTVRTETAADGTFEFEYRPTAEPLSTDRLAVEYVPANDSVYLGSEATVDVSIEQVEPSVSDLETVEEVAYGESATVRGRLHVDGTSVDGVPLDVTLGDERLGTVETANGTFEAAPAVPASIPDGERELDVRLDYEDRALAATTAASDVTVRETEVDVDVSATRVSDDGRTVAVEGTLETADGEAVADRPVRLRANGTPLETVTTDDEGGFTATVEIPDEAVPSDVDVVATHDGAESNLASGSAASTVTFADDERSWLEVSVRTLLGVGGGVVVTLGLGALVWRSRARTSRSTDGAPQSSESTPNADGEPIGSRSGTAIADSVLEHAREALDRGRPNRAVELGYAAVRHALSDRMEIDARSAGATLTHWEFYRRWTDRREAGADGDSESTAALLRTVTERYERATFDVADVSGSDAERALETAETLCRRFADGDDGSRSDSSDG